MLSMTSFQDVLPQVQSKMVQPHAELTSNSLLSGLSFMWHLREQRGYSFAIFFVLTLTFKVFAIAIIWRVSFGQVLRGLIHSKLYYIHESIKNVVCPKRRARFFKCSRRAARRRRHREDHGCCSTEPNSKEQEHADVYGVECQAFAATLCKLHLPPPLPFVRRGKTCRRHYMAKKEEGVASKYKETLRPQAEVSQSRNSSEDTSLSTTTKKEDTSTPPILTSEDYTPSPLLSTSFSTAYSTPLIDLARMQQWKAILTSRTLNRHEAKYRDADGLYALHWACSGGPPVEVIQVLLQTYPSAAKKIDQEGSTPLHFACHYSASVNVMEALLKVYPKAIRLQDRYGRTPLFHAVDKASSMDVLKLLVKSDPSMVLKPCLPREHRNSPVTRSAGTRTPLYVAWTAVLANQKTRTELQGKIWDKAQMLLEAAWRHESNMSPSVPRDAFHLLSVAIQMDLYLPEPVLPMAIKSEQKQRQEQNSTMTCIQSPLLTASSIHQYSPERSASVIHQLLEAFPGEARNRDRFKRSSLSYAVSSGKRWNSGIEKLLDFDPDALEECDLQTKLPPALLAAVAAEEEDYPMRDIGATAITGRSGTDENNPYDILPVKIHDWTREMAPRTSPAKALPFDSPKTEHTDTVYRLLRANPAVVYGRGSA